MKVKVIIKRALLLLVIAGLLVLGGLTFNAYGHPLGPTLEKTNPTNQASIPITNPAIIATAPPITEQAVSSTVTPIVYQTTFCGETGAWNLLILGSDASDLRGPKGSDLTRVARVDFSNQKVTIYAFPRDLWVTTKSVWFKNPVIDADRLGQIFYEARLRSTQMEKRIKMVDATNATANAMTENFSIHFDHYLTVDLLKLPEMIDTIGGVPMNVPERTTDPWIGMVIEAGQQTLNGEQVQAYARAIPDSDFARIHRDTILLEALRQRLLDPLMWVKIPQLYEQVKEATVTDLSPEQIIHLSCLMKNLSKESIIQDVVKPEWTTPRSEGSLLWDKEKVFTRLRELDLIQ